MVPHRILLACALALLLPSHQDASTPSPCWAPHFMTQERLMFSNPTLSEPRLCPAATKSDDMLSARTPPLQCASVLQPASSPQNVASSAFTFLIEMNINFKLKCLFAI